MSVASSVSRVGWSKAKSRTTVSYLQTASAARGRDIALATAAACLDRADSMNDLADRRVQVECGRCRRVTRAAGSDRRARLGQNGLAARWIAPSTPQPSSDSFATVTMASTSWTVMSPSTASIAVMARTCHWSRTSGRHICRWQTGRDQPSSARPASAASPTGQAESLAWLPGRAWYH